MTHADTLSMGSEVTRGYIGQYSLLVSLSVHCCPIREWIGCLEVLSGNGDV